MEAMEAALNFVLKWGGLLAFILIPLWPLLALPAGVFSEGQHSTSALSLQPFFSNSFRIAALTSICVFSSEKCKPNPVASRGTERSRALPILVAASAFIGEHRTWLQPGDFMPRLYMHAHYQLTVPFAAGYFYFWVILSMIWGLVATFIATLMPIVESRETLKNIGLAMVGKGGSGSTHGSDTSDPPLKVVDMPQTTAGDDTAHKGPSKYVV